MKQPQGVVTPPITPLRRDESLDVEALKKPNRSLATAQSKRAQNNSEMNSATAGCMGWATDANKAGQVSDLKCKHRELFAACR